MLIHLVGSISDGLFAEWLLQLGNEKAQCHLETGMIQLPQYFFNIVTSTNELINMMFPNIRNNFKSQKWLCERTI